jgi:hypothetical protein
LIALATIPRLFTITSSLAYFETDFLESFLIRKSKAGTPANIIQGTRDMVRTNVRWYNGNADNCCPNRNKNNVIEG